MRFETIIRARRSFGNDMDVKADVQVDVNDRRPGRTWSAFDRSRGSEPLLCGLRVGLKTVQALEVPRGNQVQKKFWNAIPPQ